MAIALVSSDQAFSGDNNGFESAEFNTTGANFIIASLFSNSGDWTISDDKSNSWIRLTQRVAFFDVYANRLFYTFNATTGTAHQFTVNGTGHAPAMCIQSYSGVLATDPLDAGSDTGNDTDNGSANSIQPGTVTPSENDCLIIESCFKTNNGALTINGGFTLDEDITNNDFGHRWGAMAHLIQTTAAAANPTWSWGTTDSLIACQAVFKAAGAGGGGIPIPVVYHHRQRNFRRTDAGIYTPRRDRVLLARAA